jgi:hypothetical protein
MTEGTTQTVGEATPLGIAKVASHSASTQDFKENAKARSPTATCRAR